MHALCVCVQDQRESFLALSPEVQDVCHSRSPKPMTGTFRGFPMNGHGGRFPLATQGGWAGAAKASLQQVFLPAPLL